MKYKVGIRKNNAITRVVGSWISDIMTDNIMLESNTKPKRLGKESFSNLPWQLKKPYLLSNLTSWADFVIKGTLMTVAQNTIPAIRLSSLKNCDIVIPMVIPSQNIIFQKLSLLSRVLIQFITIYTFIYNGILAALGKPLKRITSLSLVILLFSSTVVNAEDLKSLISNMEKQYSIPQGLLYSIALVESRVNPYAINVEGKAILLNSKTAAPEAIKYYITQGYTNIDIGVMQINYRWHGKEFVSLEEMLDEHNNVKYAAKLLTSLYKKHGSWHKATRLYHSATPKYHKQYSKKIITAWLKN